MRNAEDTQFDRIEEHSDREGLGPGERVSDHSSGVKVSVVSVSAQRRAAQWILLHRLRAMWRKMRRRKPKTPRKLSPKKVVKRAKELGYFITEARPAYVYVPRQRVADRDPPPPPLLNRDLAAFYEAADKVITDAVTFLRYPRLFTIWQALANTKHIPGAAMAEIGVWRGGVSYFLACGRRRLTGSDAPLVSIDTYKGHPPETLDAERDPFQRPQDFASTSREQVRHYLRRFPLAEIVQGEATKVLPILPERRYFLVHIDTDIYASTLACLKYFHPRLAPGGIIVIDDYGAKTCPGVAMAFHDWLPGVDDCQFWQMETEQCLITKLPVLDQSLVAN